MPGKVHRRVLNERMVKITNGRDLGEGVSCLEVLVREKKCLR